MSMSDDRIFHLARGECLRLGTLRQQAVICRSGSLWITRDGSPKDTVLVPGEAFRPDGRGCVIVSAIDAACAIVRSPARVRHAPTMRIGLILAH